MDKVKINMKFGWKHDFKDKQLLNKNSANRQTCGKNAILILKRIKERMK